MKDQLPENESPSARKIPIDWADSEWFQVWLKLARREDQGDPRAQHGLALGETGRRNVTF